MISLHNFRIHFSSSVLIFNKQSYVNMVSFKENSQDIHVRGLDNSRYVMSFSRVFQLAFKGVFENLLLFSIFVTKIMLQFLFYL